MSEKNLDILFYISSNESELDENDIEWINNFKFILEISLHQVLKSKSMGFLGAWMGISLPCTNKRSPTVRRCERLV